MKHNNVIIEIILFPLFIIKYFFIGLKVLFYDSFKSFFKLFENNNVNELKLIELKKALDKRIEHEPLKKNKKAHVYKYIYKDSSGKIIKGMTMGHSLQEVYTFLQNESDDIYDIKTSFLIDAMYKETNIGSTRLSNKNLIFWLTQLSTYLKAGLTLNESIKILQNQMKVTKTQKQAMQMLYYEINLGENFSTALEHQKRVFPSLLINMIRAAEASGTLNETLEDMANYYTEIDQNHKQMISAITYPAIIFFFSIAVIIFIMVYVVPQFERIYANSDAPVEGVTKIVLQVSNFTKTNIVSILAIIAGVVALFVIGYKYNKDIRRSIQSFLMHLPIIKNIIIYNEISIFAKTLSSLLKNNVYITDSMDLLSKITNNEIYKEIFDETIANVVNGDRISDSFKNNYAIPEVAYYMIVTGENTGELQPMMEKVSDYFRSQHKSLIDNFKTFIEPILITLLAVVVGFIIISVIIPMFDIYGTIK